MEKLLHGAEELMKHGDVKSVKIKDGDKKLKVKFGKREKAIEKAKKSHSVPH